MTYLVRWVVVSLEGFVTQIGYDLKKVQLSEESEELKAEAGRPQADNITTLVMEA